MNEIGEQKENLKTHLPVHNKLDLIYILSVVIVVLIGVGTISGLLNPDRFYPSEALLQAFLPNDIVYLAIGVPMFLLAMVQTWRSKTFGVLSWVGAMIFSLYNSVAYVYALPFHWVFLIHLLLAVIIAYAILHLLTSIDGEKLAGQFRGKVHEKLCGGVLAGFGLLFFLRVMGVFINAIGQSDILSRTEIAPNLSDIITAPAYILVGISLWRKKPLGYIGALGLLFQASMLFVALLAYFVIKPGLTHTPFAPVDFVVVLLMGMICFVPFGLFVRGVMRNR